MELKTKGDIDYKDNVVYLANTDCTYVQISDNHDDDEPGGMQELTLSQVCVDGGKFFVLETRRWAVNEIKDLIKVLKDYQKRIK